MPLLPLVIGTIAPMIVVWMAPDVESLAHLYAIGVVGAVALNLGSTSTNPRAAIGRFERVAMNALAGLMVVVWVTIAWEKPHALAFALTVVGLGLVGRWAARHREEIRTWTEKRFPALVEATETASARLAVSAAALAGRARVVPAGPIKTRILVATRGNPRLTKFAIDEARAHHGELLVLFVRHIAVTPFAPVKRMELEDDPEAVEMLTAFREQADAAEVPAYFIYSMAYDIAEAILETAATQAVDTLLLGTTRRGVLWRAMKGDVIQQVAAHLPERITLLVHG
jgi:nucleotide-binding universal stress UspA family protein